MKLLFDQNLSFKLCSALSDLFPESRQVGQIGLAKAYDSRIWQASKSGGFTLVSQDADFAEIALLKGPPPKVIWLRCGNKPTAYIANRLRSRADAFLSFEEDPASVCLEIY